MASADGIAAPMVNATLSAIAGSQILIAKSPPKLALTKCKSLHSAADRLLKVAGRYLPVGQLKVIRADRLSMLPPTLPPKTETPSSFTVARCMCRPVVPPKSARKGPMLMLGTARAVCATSDCGEENSDPDIAIAGL